MENSIQSFCKGMIDDNILLVIFKELISETNYEN